MEVFFLLILASCFGCAYFQQIKPEEFVAAVLDETDKPICAGAFIHKQYVVTTAKCIYMKSDLKVAFESANTNDNNKKFDVTMAYIHPYYRAPLSDYDIAILRVDSAGNDRNIKPLNLPNEDLENVAYLFTGGWKPDAANQKYENGVSILIARNQCTKTLEKDVTVTRRLFCLDNSNVDFPFIDGSPANIIKDDQNIKKLVGIATRHFDASKASPILYVNTAHPEILVFLRTVVP